MAYLPPYCIIVNADSKKPMNNFRKPLTALLAWALLTLGSLAHAAVSYSLAVNATKTLNLTYRQRETVAITFTVYTDATYATAYDLTGCTVYAQVRKSPGTDILVDLTPTITSEAAGTIDIDAEILADIESQAAQWDLFIQLADGEKRYLAKGKFKIDGSISDDNSDPVYSPSGVDLQTRLTNTYARGVMNLPYGETNITTTILTENKTGLTVRGHGNTWGINPQHSQMGSRSTIVWATSNNTLPMVDVRGAQSSWSDMAIHGDAWNTSTSALNKYGGFPTAGFLVSQDAGLGSGKHFFQNITVDKCATAFQGGEATGDNNCDVCTLNHVRVRSCPKVLYQKNLQGLGWDFTHLNYEGTVTNWTAATAVTTTSRRLATAAVGGFAIGDCMRSNSNRTTGATFDATEASNWTAADDNIAFDFEGGGDLSVRHGEFIARCTILRLRQIYSNGPIGSNGANFSFYDTKVDATARGTTLVNIPSTTYSHTVKSMVQFVGGQVSGAGFSYAGENKRLMILRGGVHVAIVGMWFPIVTDDSIEWHTDGDTYVTSCKWDRARIGSSSIEAMYDAADSDGTLYVFVDDCINGNGDPIYDPNNPNAVAEGDTEFMLTIEGAL